VFFVTDLSVTIGKVKFEGLIWLASGTCGSGEELAEYIDLGRVGAIVTKTVTLEEREGNPPPRVIETASGMLNSIGLENKGARWFRQNKYPILKKQKTKTVVSFAASKESDFVECARELNGKDFPHAFELNLSCPNVAHGTRKGFLISQDKASAAKTVKAVKKAITRPLIVKLSPNVTDIGEIAKACEDAGADAIAAVNTFQGVAVDAEKMEAYFTRVAGGLSGPAIKPLALKAVRDVYKAVKIPVIGIGGIMTGVDVAEFLLCGASAVQIGTATLRDPFAYDSIFDEFKEYLGTHKIKKAKSLTGKLKERV
jgi:dihydroorotate dehydrogenase (NAD+) catalytic subunit